MNKKPETKWAVLWVGLLSVLFAINASYGVTVTLYAYVSFELQDENENPLADGSVVYIMGSGDNVNDGMTTYGGTNYIADSVLGDDILIGTVPLEAWQGDGTFYAGPFFYDSTQVNYLYIRFFNSQSQPVLGTVYWNVSPVIQSNYHPVLYYHEVDFTPDGPISTTNRSNFVVIPEPNTAHLLLIFGALMGGLKARIRKVWR